MYTTLNPDAQEIRLLRIRDNATHREGKSSTPEIVECHLEVVSLTNIPSRISPPYKALSWCWGDTNLRHNVIRVDGEEMRVPVNAFKLLKWLSASTYNKYENAAFWLDVLCINQDDVAERNEQVKLMGLIYSQADRVIICLNLDDKDHVGLAAKHSIEAIINQCREVTGGDEQSDLDKSIYQQIGSLKVMLQSDEPLPASCNWSALLQFFASTWFTRVWVIQEVVLAKGADCIFGQQSIDWKYVSLASLWMQHRRYFKSLTAHPGTIGIDNTSAIRKASTDTRELAGMLLTGSVFVSTDPRDQVYGMLGLVPPATGASLAPDYQKSVKDVYTQATRAVIVEQHDVQIITRANSRDPPLGRGSTHEKFPSWVPRYDFVFNRSQNSVRQVPVAAQTAADNRRPMRYHWPTSDLDALVVDGLIVGAINYVSPRLTQELLRIHIDSLYGVLHEIWEHTKASARIRGLSRTDAELGLSKVLTLGPSQLSLAPEAVEKVRVNFSAFLNAFGLAWSGELEAGETCSQPSEQKYQGAEDYLYSVWLHSINRRIFTTDNGYIGMGPRDVEIGDHLCIVMGCRVPLVLRPVDDVHTLQGDAYVDGIMKAEYVQDLQQRDLLDTSLQTFQIT